MANALKAWLKDLFDDDNNDAAETLSEFSDETLAACALLLEVTLADHDEDPSEIEALKRAMQCQFEIQDALFEALLGATRNHVKESISLFEHTRVLNEELDHRSKITLVEMMWDIAHADGQLDHHEEHLIRRMAELLYVEHADFILAKLASKKRFAE